MGWKDIFKPAPAPQPVSTDPQGDARKFLKLAWHWLTVEKAKMPGTSHQRAVASQASQYLLKARALDPSATIVNAENITLSNDDIAIVALMLEGNAWLDQGVEAAQAESDKYFREYNRNAINAFEKVVTYDPRYAKAYYLLTVAYNRAGGHKEKAHAAIEKAKQLAPDDMEILALYEGMK